MEDHSCSICYEKYTENDIKHSLECTHHFHTKCIIDWFRNSNTECPVCRDDPFMTKELPFGDENNEDTGNNTNSYQTECAKISKEITKQLKLLNIKDIKKKVIEVKKIRNDYKTGIRERIKKAINIQNNKIKKSDLEKIKELRKDISKLKSECLKSIKKMNIDENVINKNDLKFINNRLVHKKIIGSVRFYRYEMVNPSIRMPTKLRLIN